ncbi:ClpX C4-type zinc finger protein [Xenorhabdus stockiae]|uniref:ClpX C4-type zinc finger protein n=1 Tax=Xenorhabdus stockiae TaxID=351614 RepID=UPI003CF40AC9
MQKREIKMSHKKRIPPYPLRMPTEIREWYEEESIKNGRSLNAEIVEILKEEMNGYKAEKKHRPIKTKDYMYQENKMSLEVDKANANIGCNFCGERNNGARIFIAGPYGNICSSCVSRCVGILASIACDSVNHADEDHENTTQVQ